MKKQFNRFALAITGSTILAVAPASAANALYAPGDLVLYFQKEGGTNVAYANLGNTATFRGTASGIGGSANQLNILNLNTTLETAFGLTWQTDPKIYAGLAGVWGTSNTSTGLQNGDPHRTLYYSATRESVGTVGVANSTGRNFTSAGSGAMDSASSGIAANNNAFDAINVDTLQTVVLTSDSAVDEQNPFSIPGVQGFAFNNTFGGGVQQVGTAGNRGDYGDAGTAEFSLDLYRMLARTVAGAVTGTRFVGSFEGTIVIDNAGDVSFLVSPVPEPSTLALSGLAAGFAVFRRRRSA